MKSVTARRDRPVHAALPRHIKPMLAMLATMPANAREFSFEYKWDGVRALAYFDGRSLSLDSRNLKDITIRYPELSALAGQLRQPAIFDGEIIAADETGRVSFTRLQHRMHVAQAGDAARLARQIPIVYMIFDILYLGRQSLLDMPFARRREMLEELSVSGPAWKISPACVGNGNALLETARLHELEGIVAKHLDSVYLPGQRSDLWRKIKLTRRQEFVIAGWLPMIGHSEMIGSLLLGYYSRPFGPGTRQPADNGPPRLVYAGNVGTGFSDRQRAELKRMLSAIETGASPFIGRLPATQRGARFCEPRYVCEVAFAEWTGDGHVRHPSFKGLRDDKDPGDVVREEDKRINHR